MENLVQKNDYAAEFAYSGKLQLIFPDGKIQYADEIGPPEQFPLTDLEWREVRNSK